MTEPNQVGCWLCPNKATQQDDGKGGIEIGISKWFNSIEPWACHLIICNDCYKKIAKQIKLTDFEKGRIAEQEIIKRCQSCGGTDHSFCTKD